MTDLLSSVLNPTYVYGFLKSKISSTLAKRLKDGDVTDEECRRLIIRTLDNIKSKLDGLARKDLLSSLCFLQEGINRLFNSLPSTENTPELTNRATLDFVEATSSRDTGINSTINEAIAIINAITTLKICSNERFKSAIESFKLARENATKAFCNEGLAVEDRIQASGIRMLSRILESLDDPDASVSDCLQYVKQLHDIGAIREMFSVLINGGIKGQFHQTKRVDIISSVQVMNQVLFEYARKFMKVPMGIFDWPKFLLGKKIYHPLLGESHLVEKLEEFGVEVMLVRPDFTFDGRIYRTLSVVNSKGEIVAHMLEESAIKIFEKSGESRTVCEVPKEESFSECRVIAMDIDAEDNIYFMVRFRETGDEFWNFKLFMFDSNGNKKLESPLLFLRNICLKTVHMTVSKDGKIAILDCDKMILTIGSVCFELNSFKFNKRFSLNELFTTESTWLNLRFSDFDGIKIIAADESTIYILAVDGKLQQKIKVLKGEENEYIYSVTINHITKGILIKTWSLTLGYRLLSYSKNGDLIDSLFLGSDKWIEYAKLISHPNGPVALVNDTGACSMKMLKEVNI